MMDKDHIPVGVGGEGGILPNGTILPNGMSTAGGCKYRQAIPVGLRGRQDINSNFSLPSSVVYIIPVVYDLDMSSRDFPALLYLLKLPVELINLKGILVSPTGWATSDTVYDLLHMIGRKSAMTFQLVLEMYLQLVKCIQLSLVLVTASDGGGVLDSDMLYGLARDLPRSPRRYTAENSVKSGAPRDTDHPELRQPSEVDEVYIVGGNIDNDTNKGNVFTVPSNEHAEFNIFLDPLAAKTVFESKLNITLIPLQLQKRVCSFCAILNKPGTKSGTPESVFSERLLSRLWQLQLGHSSYHHVDIFLGEILRAVILGGHSHLNITYNFKPLKIVADGDISSVG
ncbi:hypothetical protein Q3G72_004435 [Acer saccharum]|nr:hypothetical protein Q3G72_004435 [Acer saccharum]